MRQGDFKAVMVPAPYGTGEWRQFNVLKDPGEAKDLSTAMPDKLETLKAAWDRYAKEVGVVLPE
jgi:arylsulfatase